MFINAPCHLLSVLWCARDVSEVELVVAAVAAVAVSMRLQTSCFAMVFHRCSFLFAI